MHSVVKWEVPEGGGAPLLCMPNIPKPLHGCLEPDAEVMTPAGWVSIKDAQKDMNILCWDNGEVFWDRVQGTVKEYYDTAIKVKYRKAHNFDMVYSPNHRIVAEYKERYHGAHKEKLDKPIWRSFVRTAYDFRPGPSTYFPTAARMRGEGGLTDRERVYIAIQADGRHKRMTAKNEYYYVVRVSKVRKQQRLDELLPKSGLHYRKNEYDTKDGKHVYSYHIMSPVECKNLYSCFSLKRMSYNKAREMIQEFCKWDGYEGSSIFGTARQYYCSTNEKNIGFVQAVAMMGGYTTTTHKREEVPEKGWSALWHVWFRDTTRRSTAKVVKEEIPYNDYMYCVTVPSSFFVVRYHGVVMVTGNCAPRTIMGTTLWAQARTECYEACNRHCEVCGVECGPGKMDAHELYDIDYEACTSTFVRLVGLCKKCHSTIHSGRAITCYRNHTPLWNKQVMLDLARHGFELVHKWNKLHEDEEPLRVWRTFLDWLSEPSLHDELSEMIGEYDIHFYGAENGDGENGTWNKWKLIYNGTEYYSPYEDMGAWATAMDRHNKQDLARNNLFAGDEFEQLRKNIGG